MTSFRFWPRDAPVSGHRTPNTLKTNERIYQAVNQEHATRSVLARDIRRGALAVGPCFCVPGMLLQLLLILSIAGTILPAAPAAAGGARDDKALLAHCSRFRAYEEGIAEDLLPWYDESGISEALMDRVLQQRTMRNRVPGLPLCIRAGKLYVIDGSKQSIDTVYPWHADEIVTYAYALSRLVARWGPALPDVEFVVETSDEPFQDLAQPLVRDKPGQPAKDPPGAVWGEPHGRLPVMRHCKAATSPDITIPIFHFYTLHYDEKLLSAIDSVNAEHPWESRLPVAFAAGVTYHRGQRPRGTRKEWDGPHAGEEVSMVREAFSSYLSQELRHPNITYSPGFVPLSDWAKYKMVMHVDGITCSSRIWQLLTLGSVVLREQSNYFAFHDKLLRKFVHFVPFWSYRPREVVWSYNWVLANEPAARQMASRGQQFAREYLNREAIECYWALLLRQYGRLLRFTPGQRGAAGGREEGAEAGGQGRKLELVPVAKWLAAQEGRVKDWSPTRVADKLRELDLLPKKH